MNFKSVIALFMGLLIQLSQVQPCKAADPAKSCGVKAHPMSCCGGLASCPCAKETDQKQKPAPLIPAAFDLKLISLKASGTTNIEGLILPSADVVHVTASALEIRIAYAGVPLAVAFCRFVI